MLGVGSTLRGCLFFGTSYFMTMQQKNGTKKRGRPAIGQGAQIQVRLQPDLLALLDAAIVDNETRPEAIRRILTDWLSEKGYLD